MTEQEAVFRAFEYDLWANSQWIVPAEKAGLNHILEHNISASERWLARCHGFEYQPAEGSLVVRFMTNHDDWRSYLLGADFNYVISFNTATGIPMSLTLRDICAHVVNHGTYHRGEMRARAEIAGFPFPETDISLFARLHPVS